MPRPCGADFVNLQARASLEHPRLHDAVRYVHKRRPPALLHPLARVFSSSLCSLGGLRTCAVRRPPPGPDTAPQLTRCPVAVRAESHAEACSHHINHSRSLLQPLDPVARSTRRAVDPACSTIAAASYRRCGKPYSTARVRSPSFPELSPLSATR